MGANSVVNEANWLAMNAGLHHQDTRIPENWNGEPQNPPDYYMKMWNVGDYWYICTSDNTTRVISADDTNRTLEDAIANVAEQLRLLLLPEYRKSGDGAVKE